MFLLFQYVIMNQLPKGGIMLAYKNEYLPNYTYDDYKQWEGDWELIYGVPYAMSPAPNITHQEINLNIGYELKSKLKACKNCKALPSYSDEEDKTELAKAYDIWEIKENAFWTKYFTERASYVSEYQETIAHDVNVKMELFFYDDKKRSDLYN